MIESDIREAMHSILEAMVGRLYNEIDSKKILLPFWASRLILFAALI